ncbi:sporulation membrane protein YtrI [Ornithinibacillus bavariensis]|uniref:Sporulation membrane protein YtrI n=1 Tax=Ornithinibacillus bavariensis TaxID=545502 RepID=A0A919XBC6_9BACI|nr:sporulation membrane protein YtrI [Ornithinibacillus bavariensis]GIO27817.1 sporulation membrane protein YtrI [Ornithinibacillus bavariensis]
MHVPPYYKRPGWQRFFVGMFFGALLSYWVVLFMYGTMYERQIKENSSIQAELDDAQDKINALMKDNQDLNEKSKKPVTINEIVLEIINAEDLKIDRLLLLQLESLVKEEIKDVFGKDIQAISDSDILLISAIENKSFKVDDFTYSFEIKRLIISSTIRIVAKADIAD